MATSLSAQTLTPRQKHLATLAALEAQGDLVQLEPAIVNALDGGITINEIKEVFSQLYAYTGFASAARASTRSGANLPSASMPAMSSTFPKG